MAPESKSFPPAFSVHPTLPTAKTSRRGISHSASFAICFQIALVFSLIMVAVWTHQGRVNTAASLLAMACILWLSARGAYSARELGLTRPRSGAAVTLAIGALMLVVIAATGPFTRILGPPRPVPWHRAWQYAIWALEQEFILQSFFYVRLESLLGSGRGLWAAASLFAVAHIPSPALTAMSFVGALFFCEMFRRYRNIYPLGLVHAAIGLTIAASLPDSFLHHMRVGIGYLAYHP